MRDLTPEEFKDELVKMIDLYEVDATPDGMRALGDVMLGNLNEFPMIPGPLPERPDNYVTNDPEPWERFDGSRTAHTGTNLYGSGYRFNPREGIQ